MLKAILKMVTRGVVLVMSISFLSACDSRSHESSVHAGMKPQSSLAVQELACVLPSKPTFTADIPDQQLIAAGLKVIKEAKGLKTAKEALFFYEMYEAELANFPENLNDFKSRFDTTKSWQLEQNEKGRLLAMHKENFDATCVNYTRALKNKYSMLLKTQRQSPSAPVPVTKRHPSAL